MARYRTLKPQTWSDANLSACSRDARLLFIGLWSFVDDKGRAQLSYQQLKNQIFPADLDIDAKTVEQWFAELVRVHVVEIYEVHEHRKTVRYFRLPNFLKHQKIEKPSHVDTPPSPTEDPVEAECQCRGCQSRRFLQERGEESANGRRVGADKSPTSRSSSVGVGVEVAVEVESQKQHTYSTADRKPHGTHPQTSQGNTPASENREKDRNSPSTVATEIAARTLDLLGIPANSNIIQALSNTIQIRAGVETCSVELAGQKIAGRAMVARETPPDTWLQWFLDARYDYVPKGDKRINQRGQVARPVCGGRLCADGWEPVQVGGARRLRRCPDCAQLWQDLGLE